MAAFKHLKQLEAALARAAVPEDSPSWSAFGTGWLHRMKSKALCQGCRNDYYNGTGAAECWSYKGAKLVTRFRIGWWTAPTVPGAFKEVRTLTCHHAPGKYAHYDKLPDLAAPQPEEVNAK